MSRVGVSARKRSTYGACCTESKIHRRLQSRQVVLRAHLTQRVMASRQGKGATSEPGAVAPCDERKKRTQFAPVVRERLEAAYAQLQSTNAGAKYGPLAKRLHDELQPQHKVDLLRVPYMIAGV